MFEYKEFCSNPECAHITTYLECSAPEKFCAVCGEPIVYECPSCKTKFSKHPVNCCTECGTKLR